MNRARILRQLTTLPNGTKYPGSAYCDTPEHFGVESGFRKFYKWSCENCGPLDKQPDSKCTYQGCGFENFSGPEPDEWESVCPECGQYEVSGEWKAEDHDFSLKILARRRVPVPHRAPSAPASR